MLIFDAFIFKLQTGQVSTKLRAQSSEMKTRHRRTQNNSSPMWIQLLATFLSKNHKIILIKSTAVNVRTENKKLYSSGHICLKWQLQIFDDEQLAGKRTNFDSDSCMIAQLKQNIQTVHQRRHNSSIMDWIYHLDLRPDLGPLTQRHTYAHASCCMTSSWLYSALSHCHGDTLFG